MNKQTFDTPILFIVFNRPDMTRIIFKEIKKLRPTKLYIAGDGPREANKHDEENCKMTREIFNTIDWPCEMHTRFLDKNLGCKYGVNSAIDWFFDNVEEGIILEDDDLPDESFFPFCQELLEKYRDDPQVMNITGTNCQGKNKNFKTNDSYYFSRIPYIWGWASWRRAWILNDVEVKDWPEMQKKQTLLKLFNNDAIAYFWNNKFSKYYKGIIDSYDGQWVFTCLQNNGLCIVPSINLISNIGFGANSTHTSSYSDFANMPTHQMKFPLKHPAKMEVNVEADRYAHKYVFEINRDLNQKIKWFLKSNFPRLYLLAKNLFYSVFR